MGFGEGALLTWAWRGEALVPPDSGDAALVLETEDSALVAVVDGLGHGPRAAAAAGAALAAIAEDPGAELASIMAVCHESLRGTRGVALTLARFSPTAGTLTWLGVGNVEATLWRADGSRERLPTRGGVVGYVLSQAPASTVRIAADDMLVVATDGLQTALMSEPPRSSDVRRAAREFFAAHARGTDDALVLVARYLATAPRGIFADR